MGHISIDGNCYKTTHAEWQFTLFVSLSTIPSFRPTTPPSSVLHYASTWCQGSLSVLSSPASRSSLNVVNRSQKWGVWRHNVSLGWKESRYAQTGTVHWDCVRVCVCVCLLLLSCDIWDDYQHRSIIFAQDNSGILKLYHFPLIIISSPVNHGNAAATRPWTDSRSIFTIPAIYRFLSAFLSQHTHIERHSFAFISSGTHRATVHGSGEFPVIQSWLKD